MAAPAGLLRLEGSIALAPEASHTSRRQLLRGLPTQAHQASSGEERPIMEVPASGYGGDSVRFAHRLLAGCTPVAVGGEVPGRCKRLRVGVACLSGGRHAVIRMPPGRVRTRGVPGGASTCGRTKQCGSGCSADGRMPGGLPSRHPMAAPLTCGFSRGTRRVSSCRCATHDFMASVGVAPGCHRDGPNQEESQMSRTGCWLARRRARSSSHRTASARLGRSAARTSRVGDVPPQGVARRSRTGCMRRRPAAGSGR